MLVEGDDRDLQAEQFARNFLRNPGNSVAAVCDVYGGESPAPVKWLWADGGEIKLSPHPPEAWMDASLRQYLQVLQKEVVRWRKPPD